MKFKVEDDKQILFFDDSKSSQVELTLKHDSVCRRIGSLLNDRDQIVYLTQKKDFKFKKLKGYSINFSLLIFIDRIDIFNEDKTAIFKISRSKALSKGFIIYSKHEIYESQIFIPLKFFIEYRRNKETLLWNPKK